MPTPRPPSTSAPTSCRSSTSAAATCSRCSRSDEDEGLWIIENIFQNGFAVQTHRHTGPVFGYTVSGRVEVRGVRLREPRRVVPLRAGRIGPHPAVHRGRHPGVVPDVRRQPEPRRRRQRRVGESTAPARSALYRSLCEAAGLPGPPCWSAEQMATSTIDLYSPDVYVDGPPHAILEELRRTTPVYWQGMPASRATGRC